MSNCGDPYPRACSTDGKGGELAAAIVHLGTRLKDHSLVTISAKNRRQHLYTIGQTGTGKTTWLLSLMKQDAAYCFIDKHGDAAKQIADSTNCIYWRPADLSNPIGLNLLQNVAPDDRWKVTADIVSVFSDIWDLGEATPRLLYYLRSAVRLLLDTEGTTLLDIRRVLSDDTYRKQLLRRAVDRETLQTWNEFNAKPLKDQTIEVGSLQNKVAALADPLPLRYVIGQPTSTIDIAKIMDEGKKLIVDLSGMGDEPTRLLGALLVSAFSQAAEARATIAEHDRKDFTLYIDEFQNFASNTFQRILSEARKWRLSLVLAHQYAEQIEKIMPAVLGNCGTLVSFRVGASDAPLLAKALDAPEQELKDLPTGMAYIRLAQPSDSFPMQTQKVPMKTGWLKPNTRNTAANWARPRSKVEEMLRPRKEKKRRSWGSG